jgi:hypothetical protein
LQFGQKWKRWDHQIRCVKLEITQQQIAHAIQMVDSKPLESPSSSDFDLKIPTQVSSIEQFVHAQQNGQDMKESEAKLKM